MWWERQGGVLWEGPDLLFCLALFRLFEFAFAFVSWQPCIYHKSKVTLELISVKRHYSAHSPVQHKFALSGEGTKARKWVLRRVLPGCLYSSGQQYWENSDNCRLSSQTWLTIWQQDFCLLPWIWVSLFWLEDWNVFPHKEGDLGLGDCILPRSKGNLREPRVDHAFQSSLTLD